MQAELGLELRVEDELRAEFEDSVRGERQRAVQLSDQSRSGSIVRGNAYPGKLSPGKPAWKSGMRPVSNVPVAAAVTVGNKNERKRKT